MITMPKLQRNHKFIDSKIQPWLDLHFPADSRFNGRIFLTYRRKDGNGIYDLSRRNIAELFPFVEEMHVSLNMDYYITANSMCGVRRVTEDVFGLHNIVFDVDCHAEALSPTLLADFIWRCSRDLWNTEECPEPNSIMFSVRGVQLWWAQKPEMAAEEPMAAGAEYQTLTKPTSSKMVRNNIVSYGEGVSLVSSARGQAIKIKGLPPPE